MLQRFLAGSPVLALFLLGFILRQNHFFGDQTVADIKKFVLNISLPALLFNSFLSIRIKPEQLALPFVLFILCTVMLFMGDLISRLMRIKTPYFTLLMSGFEMGMFGYAVFMALYGQEYLGVISFLAMGHIVFIFTIFMARLMGLRDGKQDTWTAVRRIIGSPIIISIVAGIIAGNTMHLLPRHVLFSTAGDIIRLVGSVTAPLIAITIGYGIHISRGSLSLALFTITIRKLLMVTFALLINRYVIDGLLHMESIYRYAMLSMALTPPTFIVSIFARAGHEEDSRYINSTISLDCLISVFLMMLAATFYR